MNKKNDILFITLSIIISVCLHCFAILYIDNLKIKSMVLSKNIDFEEKAIEKKPKSFSKVSKLVLKQNIKNSKLTSVKQIELPQDLDIDIFVNKIREIDTSFKSYTFEIQNFENNKIKLLNPSKCVSYFNFQENNIDQIIDDLKAPFNSLEKNLTQENNIAAAVENLEQFKSKIYISDLFNENIQIFKNNTLLENSFIEKFKTKNIFDIEKIIFENQDCLLMPTLDELSTLAYKDFFDIDVSLDKDDSSSSYIFAITLVPKQNIKLDPLKRNFFFLIDKSNSIQQERLNCTRQAVISALHQLNKNDSFNIITFDSKIDILSDNNIAVSNRSINDANKFLLNQKIGSFFSSTNFSQPLFKLLNNNSKSNEVNNAILLSNGEGLNKIKKYKVFNQFTQVNNGNFSLYSLGVEDDKNLQILNLFAKLNKGESFVASNYKNIKRKLFKVIKTLNEPIAKDLVATTITNNPENNLFLYPNNDKVPNLFLNQPYVIFGTTQTLDDFTIFLQGKSSDKFLNLKKVISFQNAKVNNPSLKKELAMKKASFYYSKYLADNNPLHLENAKHLLEPFNLEPTFK